MIYECHITSTVAHEAALTALAAVHGWKTSEIKRDPLLGDDSYFYLTKHAKHYVDLFAQMEDMAHMVASVSAPVIRKKIEHIIYDTKRIEQPA